MKHNLKRLIVLTPVRIFARTIRSFGVLSVLVLTIFTFAVTSPARAGDFEQEWSGWFVPNSEVDIDGNGTGGESTFFGRGTFGRAANHLVTDVVFSGEPCDFDPVTGIPNGVTLLVIQHTNVLVDRNGDHLYRMLSSFPESTVCLNPVAQTATLTAYLEILGGTGRFEGATGSSVFRTKIRIVGLQNAVTGTEEGWIFGVEDDDYDSDSD